MTHHTMRGPLPPRRRAQVCRVLALSLAPLLRGLWTEPRPARLPVPIPLVLSIAGVRRHDRRACPQRVRTHAAWVGRYAGRRGLPPLVQASGILLLLGGSGWPCPFLLLLGLPLLRWLLAVSALGWPTWSQGPAYRCLRHIRADLQTAVLRGLALHMLCTGPIGPLAWTAVLAAPRGRSPKPTASGRSRADGTYDVVRGAQFAIRPTPVDAFDRRMVLRFLRDMHLLDRPSKWPCVGQVGRATWFGTLPALISRWEAYRDAADWPRLMRRRAGPRMPLAPQQPIIRLWARHLGWTVEEVTAQAGAPGRDGCPARVRQIGHASGVLLARPVVRQRFQLGPALLRPKDDWLVDHRFALLEQLQARLLPRICCIARSSRRSAASRPTPAYWPGTRKATGRRCL